MTLLRSHGAVVAAAIAIALGALAAVAWMLGWIPAGAAGKAPAPASAASAAATNADGAIAGLDANETVVSAVEPVKRQEPLMPTYSTPAAPPPAPREADVVSTPRPAPRIAIAPRASGAEVAAPAAIASAAPDPAPREPYVQGDDTRPGPTTPSFKRGQPRHPPASRAPRVVAAGCANCGVVSSITSYPGLWDVRVRLEEGGAQTFRYRTLPPYRIGDRVRVDGAHLTFD
jgi:hypothetical protein